jgi:hypothetical protein
MDHSPGSNLLVVLSQDDPIGRRLAHHSKLIFVLPGQAAFVQFAFGSSFLRLSAAGRITGLLAARVTRVARTSGT